MIQVNNTLVSRFWTNSAIYRSLVDKAIHKMNEALRKVGVVCCYSENGHDFEVVFVSAQELARITGNSQVLGLWKPNEQRIYIAKDHFHPRNESEDVSTIMHEMLHAIGLGHLPQEHSLMYKIDGVRGLTVYEVEAIANLKGKKMDSEVNF